MAFASFRPDFICIILHECMVCIGTVCDFGIQICGLLGLSSSRIQCCLKELEVVGSAWQQKLVVPRNAWVLMENPI